MGNGLQNKLISLESLQSGGSGTTASLPYTVRHQRVLPRYSTNSIVQFLWQIHVPFKMSFLSILSYWVFTWSRKAWAISESWWLLSGTKLCIYNPSIFLFRDNDSGWSMSKWSASLQVKRKFRTNILKRTRHLADLRRTCPPVLST